MHATADLSGAHIESLLQAAGRMCTRHECEEAIGLLEEAVRYLWMPSGYRDTSSALRGVGMELGIGSAFHLLREFGNYWIVDLDPEYRWAVVGEPDRKYLGFLAGNRSSTKRSTSRSLIAPRIRAMTSLPS